MSEESILERAEKMKMADGVKACYECKHYRPDIRGCAAVITIDLVTGGALLSDAAVERYGAKGFIQTCGSEGKLWAPKLND